jgi:hypothetical protein
MTLNDLRSRLGERFADAWVLLSDTDRFLSRARLMPRYERRVREWRRRLTESSGDPETVREIRSEIVAVRKGLREQGWELRLGSLDIAVKGFRSDDSLARGFRRLVLYLAVDGGIYYTQGDANHVALDEELRHSLRAMKITGPMTPHYLWYRIGAGLIELAGADSESRESFEQLKESVEARKSDLIRALGKLR